MTFYTNTFGTLNFGDGTSGQTANCGIGGAIGDTPSCNTTHTYSAAGTYTATLTSNGQEVGSATVTVTGPSLPGTLSATPTSGAEPLAVSFTAPGAGATINFGDGSTGALSIASTACTGSYPGSCTSTASHTYQSAGTYTAILTNSSGVTVATAMVAVTQ